MWDAISFSRGSSQLEPGSCVSSTGRRVNTLLAWPCSTSKMLLGLTSCFKIFSLISKLKHLCWPDVPNPAESSIATWCGDDFKVNAPVSIKEIVSRLVMGGGQDDVGGEQSWAEICTGFTQGELEV